MLRVNGLFGWVSYNDRRSAALFACFVLAFHVLAVVVLFIPLAISDPAHAPVVNWAGYGLRYVPLMTLVGAGLFLFQFWWHVSLIRAQSGFRYTSKVEEPRLCRIAEPLVIAAGLPEPRLAVIESPALNAFACGLGRSSAVIVVTRGLLVQLDDDELAAVIAHELAHIKNGDLRLMAAATVCQRSMMVLYNQGSWGGRTYREAMSLGLSMLLMPVLFLVFVAISFLRQSAIQFGYVTRALISSAREFIADTAAIELTQHPAALVSALRKIDGRSGVDGLAAENDLMMIDGPSNGALATHPSIAVRVAAIVRFTGAMTSIAPARRDTRPGSPLRTGSALRPFGAQTFGLRQKLGLPLAIPTPAARVAVHSGRNFLGFTPEMNIAACLALLAFLVINRADLSDPRQLAAHFDVKEFALIMGAIGKSSNCSVLSARDKCSEAEIGRELAEYQGTKSVIGKQLAMMAKPGEGTYVLPGGSGFSNVAPESVKLEHARKNSCFHTDRYSVGDRGLHRVDEPDGGRRSSSADISLSRYLGFIARSVSNVDTVGREQRDAVLKSYVTTRQNMTWVIHRFFGEPGLDIVLSTYAAPEHVVVVAKIRERLSDPAFTKALSELERQDYALLASDPGQFVTCEARKSRPLG